MNKPLILIVDDKEENRYLLRLLLEGAGLAVAEATHGGEGLTSARATRPDLVISDILMPVMDGFAFCREWKCDPGLRDIPFAFYTATYPDGRDRDFSLSIGADNFIVKPQEPEALVARIRELLDTASRPAAAPPSPTPPPPDTEEIFLRQYNQALVRKLETKMEQLEQDILQRQKTEARLRASEERFRSFVENANDIVFSLSPGGAFVYVSPNVEELLGYSVRELEGREFQSLVHPEDLPACLTALERVMAGDKQSGIEYRVRHRNGDWHWHMTNAAPVRNAEGQLIGLGIARDITGLKADAAERAVLQDQLVQLQKIESVGRLAGGVAHDFNNMLQVILGHVELAMERNAAGQSARDDLLEIRKAAERSSGLTRQLLAFARKQTVAPKILDLNDTIHGMLQMLRRLIGENIDLSWRPGRGLGPVRMDPSQIDQILANLCVNARDAVAGAGAIAIETTGESFTPEHCAAHPAHLPGDYIRLSVSDNGCGMDKEVLGKLFEPFFTTKPVGEGTGLGLSTVYGIVRQNHGFIDVASKPGQGTTFHVYLPRHSEAPPQAAPAPARAPAGTARETILLVEDDPAILAISRTMLERLAYRVVGARSPDAALQLARDHAGPIHLLMTDVVMPGMNGHDLAARLLDPHPHIKRLYMSGYTADVIAHHGILDDGIHFIQKPFTLAELEAKVRETLDDPRT
ncbi:MAG: response regulator [Kiritimatiellae bacterium]|nr:response regulator [Kiritimatiellia bacterium]